jgi:cytochrome c553
MSIKYACFLKFGLIFDINQSFKRIVYIKYLIKQKRIVKMKKILIATSLFACALFASDGAALYKKCATCHGANGEKVALGKSKIIKDMSKADFIAAMKGYKDGSYGGPMKGLMKGQVASLSDADIEALANHIIK